MRRLRLEGTIIVLALVGLFALSCESERRPPQSRALADSLDEAGEVLLDQKRYRAALRLYEEAREALPPISAKEDSLLKSSILTGIAYCRYHIPGLEDRSETWLEAWRLATASENTSTVVKMAQRAASLHSRSNQFALEIQTLSTADSLASADSSVSDSLRSVVREQLKGALYDCYTLERCRIPDSVSVDTSTFPPMLLILGGIAVIAVIILLGTPKRTE